MTDAGNKILLIDDEAAMRHMLRLVLEKEGYRITEAGEGAAALRSLQDEAFDLVLCDLRMPGMDGRTFLQEATKLDKVPTIIMMSAYGSLDTAIECLKEGAYDYISKPFKADEVVLTLRKAQERIRLQGENRRLRDELRRSGLASGKAGILYRSAAMGRVMNLVGRLAESSSAVLITGETGTGKELVARALHEEGIRRQGPFVAVNCGAISPTLMESELFGHGKGSFTGADRDKMGLFEAANGGTLFLDEIGELPLELQPKLLRVLQEGEVLPLGHTRPRRIDVRVLAATARDVRAEVEAKRFRDDLFYRLAVVEIHIPPLRERPEDIPLLADSFLRRHALREGRPAPRLTAAALQLLQSHPWPGNVRELENFMEKTLIFCRGESIDEADLPWEVRRRPRDEDDHYSLKQAIARLEREYIRKALAATDGNRTQAAKLLEISLRGLLYKMKEMDEP